MFNRFKVSVTTYILMVICVSQSAVAAPLCFLNQNGEESGLGTRFQQFRIPISSKAIEKIPIADGCPTQIIIDGEWIAQLNNTRLCSYTLRRSWNKIETVECRFN